MVYPWLQCLEDSVRWGLVTKSLVLGNRPVDPRRAYCVCGRERMLESVIELRLVDQITVGAGRKSSLKTLV